MEKKNLTTKKNLNEKKNEKGIIHYVTPTTKRHDSMNIVEGSFWTYTTLYKGGYYHGEYYY